MADEVKTEEDGSFVNGIIQEIINSPLNLALIAIITFLVFKIFKSRQPPKPSPPSEPELPKLRKDFTVTELKAFDGNQPDGRVLVAVNGSVYDVTRGKRFYGPGEQMMCCNRAAPFLFVLKFRLTACLSSHFGSDSPCFHQLHYKTFNTGFQKTMFSLICTLFFVRRVRVRMCN